MRDTIGLIHPKSVRHADQDLIGTEIVVHSIIECRQLPGWYSANVKLINPKFDTYEFLGNEITIYGFRPRRVK